MLRPLRRRTLARGSISGGSASGSAVVCFAARSSGVPFSDRRGNRAKARRLAAKGNLTTLSMMSPPIHPGFQAGRQFRPSGDTDAGAEKHFHRLVVFAEIEPAFMIGDVWHALIHRR